MLETSEMPPEFHDRYVDDCLMAWTHGEKDLLEFLQHCNRQHPQIRLTWETSIDSGTVNFKDLTIRVRDDYRLEYELYQKPSNSGVNLNYTSEIPMHIKEAVAIEQFRRAKSLSSSAEMTKRSEEKILTMLKKRNNYPLETIEQVCRRSRAPKGTPANKTKDKPTSIVRLPICSDGLHRQVTAICRDSKLPVRIVYEQVGNLKNWLVRSAWRKPTCNVHQQFLEQENASKRSRGRPKDDCISCLSGLKESECDLTNAVYLLTCNVCGEQYIGETARKLRLRLGEHHFQARNRSKESPWGEHMRQHQDVVINKKSVFTAAVLAVVAHGVTRKFRESIEIRERSPKINRSKGWSI